MDGGNDEQQVSAADYDPSMDRREEDARHAAAAALASGTGEVANNQTEITIEHEDSEGSDEVDDEDEDDLDDMFAIVSEEPKKKKKKRQGKVPAPLFFVRYFADDQLVS